MFKQRQRAWLVCNVAQDLVHQARLKTQSYTAGRFFDCLPEHVGVHRTHEKLVGCNARREIRKSSTFRQEIRSHRQKHRALSLRDRRRVEQVSEKLCTLPLVAAKRENLLELVNHKGDSTDFLVYQRKCHSQVKSALIFDQAI